MHVQISEEKHIPSIPTAVSYTHLDVYKRQGHDVVTTVCNGKVLMKDREVLVCDVDKVMADCRQSAQELADDINGGK